MGDLQKLEKDLKAAVGKNLSLKALEKELAAHLKDLDKHKDTIVPKIKKTFATMTGVLIDLEAERDPIKRTRLQRRLGSLKRAHFSYLKSVEVKAAWKTAHVLWNRVQSVKDFIVSLVMLVPEG